MGRYDLVIDSDLKVWLIEINCSPAMDASTKVRAEIFCFKRQPAVQTLPDNGAAVRSCLEGASRTLACVSPRKPFSRPGYCQACGG
jgi:hypothetical protein